MTTDKSLDTSNDSTDIGANTPTKNALYKPNEKELKIVQHYRKRINEYDLATRDLRNVWDRVEDAYELRSNFNIQPWESNYYLPKIYQAGENLTASNSNFNLGFEVLPGDKDTIEFSEQLERILDKKMEELVFSEKIKQINRQRIYYGTAMTRLGWKMEYDLEAASTMSKQLAQIAKNVGKKLGLSKGQTQDPMSIKLITDTMFCDVPDIRDVYLAPLYGSVEKVPEIIFKFTMTVDDIKANTVFKKYGNVDYVVGDPNGELRPHGDMSSKNINNISPSTGYLGTQQVTVYEIQTKDEMTYVAYQPSGNDVVLAITPNIYKCLTWTRWLYKRHINPNVFYGVTDIGKSLDLQDAGNDFFNQAADNVKLVNNKMFVYSKTAGINPFDLISKPGGGIGVNDIERDIRELQTTDLKSSIFGTMDKLDMELQQTTNVSNLSKGLPGGGASAAETRIQDQNRQTALYDSIDEIKISMGEMGRKIIAMMSVMQDSDFTVRYKDRTTNKWAFMMLPKDILKSGKYDLKIQINPQPPIDPAARAQLLLQTANLFIQQGIVNKSELLEIALKEQGLGMYADRVVLHNDNSAAPTPFDPNNPQGGQGGQGDPSIEGNAQAMADGNSGQMPLDTAPATSNSLVQGIMDKSGGVKM